MGPARADPGRLGAAPVSHPMLLLGAPQAPAPGSDLPPSLAVPAFRGAAHAPHPARGSCGVGSRRGRRPSIPSAPDKGEMRSCSRRRGDLHLASSETAGRREAPRWRGAREVLSPGVVARGSSGDPGEFGAGSRRQSPLRGCCRTPGMRSGPGTSLPCDDRRLLIPVSSSRAAPGFQQGDRARRDGFGFSAFSPCEAPEGPAAGAGLSAVCRVCRV